MEDQIKHKYEEVGLQMTPFLKDNAWFFSKMMQSDLIFHPFQISYV
jgi:hypothetical protein